MTRNGLTTTYTYDLLGQLIRVNDPHANKTTVYDYDCGGNILFYREYAYTTGELGTATKTVGYTYGDSNWKDKVTAIDGKAITYDAIGNPLTYDGWTFGWKAGRLLTSMVNATINAQFTYDHNGLRVKKVVNGITTDYVLNGNNIAHMTCENDELHFFYDAQDRTAMVRYNGADYFYVYNLQGDVVALVDVNGAQVVEYVYDAWGNLISKSGSMAATLGTENPFRYRGYIYDEETGMYYLKTRYYNPKTNRFINGDGFVGKIAELLTENLYTYCWNGPITIADDEGRWGWYSGTIAYGVSYKITIATYSVIYSKGIAYDDQYNISFFESVSGIPNEESEISMSFDAGMDVFASAFYQMYPGKTVDQLAGPGSSVGTSIGDVGVDLLTMDTVVSGTTNGKSEISNSIDGVQVSIGVSAGIDMVGIGNSYTKLTPIMERGVLVKSESKKNRNRSNTKENKKVTQRRAPFKQMLLKY